MKIDKLRISHSSMQMARSCWRKLEFRKFYMSSAKDDSLAASVGNALHAGYQHWLQYRDKDAATWEFMCHYPYQFESGPNDYRSLEACYSTLIALMESHSLSQYELAYINLNGSEVACVEVPFQINIEGFSLSDIEHVPVEYIGFMDLILYDVLNDVYIVVDIKTTRMTTKDMTPVYQFDEQCIPYAIVLERLLGKPIKHLSVKYLSAYIDILEPQVKLYPFEKDENDIQDWMRGMLIDLQLAKTFYQMNWFPRSSKSCFAWNKPCTFFNMCQTRNEKTIEAFLDLEKKEDSRAIDFTPWVTLDLGFGSAM